MASAVSDSRRIGRNGLNAKLFEGHEIRKAAFYLVASGVLATGAGLAAASLAGAAIPSQVGARRLRAAALGRTEFPAFFQYAR